MVVKVVMFTLMIVVVVGHCQVDAGNNGHGDGDGNSGDKDMMVMFVVLV
jgi:hypothetical protein